MKVIDLRSDTVTRPSPEMRQAMAQAEVGDDVFEDDPTVKRLEARIAEILGHEAALYVPSGTMANQISMRVLAGPGEEILCESYSHVFNNEVAGAAAISGIQLHPLGAPQGILTPEILEPHIRSSNIHTPVTVAIALENTHNRASGTVYPMELLAKIKMLTGKYQIALYLDGARLWNAAAFHKVKPSEIARYFDCVSVCFSKGLGAPVGSAVVSTKERITKARRIRKMLGGGMRQVGIIAAGALYALTRSNKGDKDGVKQVTIESGSITEKAIAVGQIQPRQKFSVMTWGRNCGSSSTTMSFKRKSPVSLPTATEIGT